MTVSKMDSGSSTDGFVATADGSGGVAYESVPEAEVEITTELRYEINGPYSDTLAMITVFRQLGWPGVLHQHGHHGPSRRIWLQEDCHHRWPRTIPALPSPDAKLGKRLQY